MEKKEYLVAFKDDESGSGYIVDAYDLDNAKYKAWKILKEDWGMEYLDSNPWEVTLLENENEVEHG